MTHKVKYFEPFFPLFLMTAQNMRIFHKTNFLKKTKKYFVGAPFARTKYNLSAAWHRFNQPVALLSCCGSPVSFDLLDHPLLALVTSACAPFPPTLFPSCQPFVSMLDTAQPALSAMTFCGLPPLCRVSTGLVDECQVSSVSQTEEILDTLCF